MLGPLMGAALLARGFGPRAVFLMQSLSGAVHLLLLKLFMRETLPPGQRAKFRGFVTPFAFAKLFRQGRQLGLLSASCGAACFADGANLNDSAAALRAKPW
eukprot:SAG31_NODE_535_length_14348_cov_11.339603_19_plen_101_part_00